MSNRTSRFGFLAGSLITLALAMPGAASAATSCENADVTPTSANVVEVRDAMLCLLNEERAGRGMSKLSSNAPLGKAAQNFSRRMVTQGFFDHVCPKGSTLLSRVRGSTSYLSGARSYSLGENIAWGSGHDATPASTMESWMQSPGHRKHILSRRFRHVGIGVVIGAPQDAMGQPAATYTTYFGYRTLR